MRRRDAQFTQVILIEDMSFGGGPFPSGPLPAAPAVEAPPGGGRIRPSFPVSAHLLAELKRRTGRATARP
jgi:hypothetical protein